MIEEWANIGHDLSRYCFDHLSLSKILENGEKGQYLKSDLGWGEEVMGRGMVSISYVPFAAVQYMAYMFLLMSYFLSLSFFSFLETSYRCFGLYC